VKLFKLKGRNLTVREQCKKKFLPFERNKKPGVIYVVNGFSTPGGKNRRDPCYGLFGKEVRESRARESGRCHLDGKGRADSTFLTGEMRTCTCYARRLRGGKRGFCK